MLIHRVTSLCRVEVWGAVAVCRTYLFTSSLSSWRCLTGSTHDPRFHTSPLIETVDIQSPAFRLVGTRPHAFTHARRAQAGKAHEPEVPVKVARVDWSPAPTGLA